MATNPSQISIIMLSYDDHNKAEKMENSIELSHDDQK